MSEDNEHRFKWPFDQAVVPASDEHVLRLALAMVPRGFKRGDAAYVTGYDEQGDFVGRFEVRFGCLREGRDDTFIAKRPTDEVALFLR